MKKVCYINAFILGTLCLAFAYCLATGEELPAVRDMTAMGASRMIKELQGDLIVLDVRTPEEFKEGHLPDARNMDFFGLNFDAAAAALPHDKTILVYCRSGKRSSGAVEEFRKKGIKKIVHLNEGIIGWENAKLPLEK